MLKSFFRENNEKLQKDPYYYHYLGCIAISLILGLVLKNNYLDKLVLFFYSSSLSNNSNVIDYSLIYSTCAAILATVFTIIFVLLTVFIQVSDIYVSADIFMEKKTLFLMLLYLFTIIFSLMMLETNITYPIIVLTLTFICILLLYPFSLYINSKLRYEIGVIKLSKEIPSLIDSGNESLVNPVIASLATICKRSIRDNRLQNFLSIMFIFETNIQHAKDKKMMKVIEEIGLQYLYILDDFVKLKLTKNRETMISLLFKAIRKLLINNFKILSCDSLDNQTYELKEIGKKMIKNDFKDHYINKIIKICLDMIYSCIQDKKSNDIKGSFECKNYLEPNIIEYIGELATESYNYKKEYSSLYLFVTAFFAIGTKYCQLYKLPDYSVIEQLMKTEKIIGTDYYEKIFRELSDSIKNNESFVGNNFFTDLEHKTYLDKFKVYYDSNKKNVLSNN